MASNCAEHVSKRKRVSRMEHEKVEYLNKTIVLLWYINEENEQRHSPPLSLSSYQFLPTPLRERINWKNGDVVCTKFCGMEFLAKILCVGSFRMCSDKEVLLEEVMENEAVNSDNVLQLTDTSRKQNYVVGFVDSNVVPLQGYAESDSENEPPPVVRKKIHSTVAANRPSVAHGISAEKRKVNLSSGQYRYMFNSKLL